MPLLPTSRRLAPLLLVTALCRAGSADDGPSATAAVGRTADGGSVTPVNQLVTPVGLQVELPGLRPQVLALSPDGRLLVTSGKTNEVVVIDPDTGEIKQRVRSPADDVTRPAGDDDSDRNLAPDAQAIQSYTGLVFRW
jgi:DNA-binding beta-propeller fold protein YncE